MKSSAAVQNWYTRRNEMLGLGDMGNRYSDIIRHHWLG